MWRFILLLNAAVYCSAVEYKVIMSDLPAPSKSHDRIVGGHPTSIEKYPYVVQVMQDNQFTCGGSLITKQHVLSAAHCFVSSEVESASTFSIRAGSSNLDSGSVHGVSEIAVHESYDMPEGDNDVAVVLLSSAVSRSQGQIARIATQGAVVPDNSFVIQVGWGKTGVFNIPYSKVLMEIGIQKVNQRVCAERYLLLRNYTANNTKIPTDNTICAGLLDVSGEGQCFGDGGGPLIYEGVVVGVMSWNFFCNVPMFPRVNTRVASYSKWIERTVLRQVPRHNASPPLRTLGVVLLLLNIFVPLISDKIILFTN